MFNILPEQDNKYCFQYIIYDFNSLIADVGGYLGLLLGQSVYGFYQILVSCKDYTRGIKAFLGLYP